MPNNDTIRIAFIGCGENAHGHGCNVSEVEGTEIVALVDPNEATLNTFRRDVGLEESIPALRDHAEMLAAVKPNAVVISTPHTLYFQQIMNSLEAGCHIHTEKPMVCTVDHAKQAIKKVEESGKHLMIGYQRHLQPAYMYCRNVM